LAPDEAWRVLRRDSQILWWLLSASLPGIFVVSLLLLAGALRQSELLPLVTFAFVAAIGVVGLPALRQALLRKLVLLPAAAQGMRALPPAAGKRCSGEVRRRYPAVSHRNVNRP
jgi:hypothetical protein